MSKTLIAICFLLMTQACLSISKGQFGGQQCRMWEMVRSYYKFFCNYAYLQAHPKKDISKCETMAKNGRYCGKLEAKKAPYSRSCDRVKGGSCERHLVLYKAICVEKKFGDTSGCPCNMPYSWRCRKYPHGTMARRLRMMARK